MTEPIDGNEFLGDDHFSGASQITDGSLSQLLNRDQTIHFNIGNIGAIGPPPPIAPTPGTFDVAASAYFGQLNIHKQRKILQVHMHLIEGAVSGSLTMELWRERGNFGAGNQGTLTLLGSMTLAAPVPNRARVTLVPADALLELLPGDYLMLQATAIDLVSVGGANGLTVDIHFAPL